MRSLLIPILLTAIGCSMSGREIAAARQVPEAARADAAAVVLANNQFACDLYAGLAGSDGNLVFSPFSISTALAMLDGGAAGATELEIRTALHAEALGDRLHAGYHALIDSIDIGRGFGGYTLSTADRLFGQTGLPFVPGYLTLTRQQYNAELQFVDFRASSESARSVINHWVAGQTAQAIPELFAAGAISPTTVLALVNAIHFKGTWANQFDAGDTRNEAFHLADGTTINVPMMHKSDTLKTAGIPIGRGARVVDLPFAGEDISLIAVVPEMAAELPAIEAQLSADAIAQWIASTRPSRYELVSLPKFTTKHREDLPAALGKLGITSAFDPLTADLSGIDGRRDLVVTAAVHEAMLAVDESGAEAAAATGVGIGPVSLNLIALDRPFVFLLYDHVTGAILFLGRIVDPTRG